VEERSANFGLRSRWRDPIGPCHCEEQCDEAIQVGSSRMPCSQWPNLNEWPTADAPDGDWEIGLIGQLPSLLVAFKKAFNTEKAEDYGGPRR